MKLQTDKGYVSMSAEVVAVIAGNVTAGCFGIKGMAARSVRDGLVHLLRRESATKGIKVTPINDNTAVIELHVAIEHNINIAAVCMSVISDVRYHVEYLTGIRIDSVDICVDSIMT